MVILLHEAISFLNTRPHKYYYILPLEEGHELFLFTLYYVSWLLIAKAMFWFFQVY